MDPEVLADAIDSRRYLFGNMTFENVTYTGMFVVAITDIMHVFVTNCSDGVLTVSS